METLRQLRLLAKVCDEPLETWHTIAEGFESIEQDADREAKKARRQIERLEKK